MSPNTYQELAMRTRNTASDDKQSLLNAALGLCGESGEVADLLKKSNFQGHSLDVFHIAKELGDILWYVALACTAIGIDMEDIMQMNIDKLKTRYPEGFDISRSINREANDI